MNSKAAVSRSRVPAAAFYWLGERLRDAAMWPINLVRDFPLRFGRLLRTLVGGVRGLLSFLRLLPARPPEAGLQPRSRAGPLAAWAHRCLAELFDLMGGPEIAQFFLRFFTMTMPLTGDEIAAVSTVLGPQALRYGDVRVAQGGILNIVFRFNSNLAFATWHTVNLPRRGRRTRANLLLVVHELIHVYQYEQVGSRYLGEAVHVLLTTQRNCYDYGGVEGLLHACQDGRRYADFNREQQAMIAQDYFVRERGELDVAAYLPFVEQLRAGEL